MALCILFAPARAEAETPAVGAEHTAKAPPDQREAWVPARQLEEILKQYPNAVVLSREQYQTLLRDAELHRKPAPMPPRVAALSAATYQAHLAGKVVQVTATLSVNVLTDNWVEAPLNFGGVSIGAVRVDGEAALLPQSTTAKQAPADAKARKAAPPVPGEMGALLLRGRGERTVVVEFTMPIASETGASRIEIKLPPAAASVFTLELPPGQRVESAQPISIKKTPEATTVSATVVPANPVLAISWRGTGEGAQQLEPLVTATGTYVIDAENVRTGYDFDITTPLGSLADHYEIAVPPDAKVFQVTGELLAKWTVSEGKLLINLQPGERAAAKFQVVLETPSLAAARSATLTLPVPKIEGTARMQGAFSIIGDDGIAVKEIATDGSVQPSPSSGNTVPHFIASYRFNTLPNAPRASVERVHPRFSADLDTLVEFKPEAIFIERTLTLHAEKGEIFQAALTLPAGEEVLTVRNPDDSEPDWRIHDRKLDLQWSGTSAIGGAPKVFKIGTRIEPPKWSQLGLDGIPFQLQDAKIDNAERVTGYIALRGGDAFRLEAEPSETLERRDGRTTPVKGDFAWFRGAEFALRVNVAKRPGEVIAALTGYALPLESVLDLHAQIAYSFLHSGTRSVRIRVPKAIAANFHFEGHEIAERNLSGDIWTIVFQKELTGDYVLNVTAQAPVERAGGVPGAPGDSDTGSEKESRFDITVPVITPLDVLRTSGTWAVEANTETEITFAAKGMNELDSLLAPKLPEYEPRHRVIGVFTWLGPDYTLALAGVRHAAASILTSVVDRLDLDTVVSTSRAERNQAIFQLRTAGSQFLDVQLPAKSRLLSLTVDDEVVKPVGDRADQVRVQLPARSDSSASVAVSVLYETPQTAWRWAGGYSIHAPKLAKNIPVLRSQWRLFLPDGFEYTGVESNLTIPELENERPLLFAPLSWWWKAQSKHVAVEDGRSRVVRKYNIERMLERIIIPKLEFREATLSEALDFLRRKSMEIDEDSPAGEKGVDIRLELEGEQKARVENSRITVSLTNIPLIEALRYVTNLAGVAFRIEPHAVVVSPQKAVNEQMANVEADLAWGRPVRRFEAKKAGEQNGALPARTERIQQKLERITIPKLELREATLREAVDFLKRKSVDLDGDSLPGDKGVNIVLKLEGLGSGPAAEPPPPGAVNIPGLDSVPPVPSAPSATQVLPPVFTNPADARITVSLTNISLIEALRHVCNLFGLKFKVEPYAVLIVPASVNTDVLITKEWKVRQDTIPRTDGPEKEAPKNWLVANGVKFDGNASAVYLPDSYRLVVRNTAEQLDLIDQILAQHWSAAETEQPQRVSGLLPMKLDLPRIGRILVLEGLAAPEQVEFHYEDWWARARHLWLWFVTGGFVCLVLAQRRPWWRTCWAALLLTAFPLVTTTTAIPVCNALLAGWLVSVVLQQVVARLVFAPRRKEVHA